MQNLIAAIVVSLLVLTVDGSPRAWGDPLPNYGVSNYSCPGTTMRRSKVVPTSAHSVRPADIKIVASMGDSLTAGNGAGAEDPLAIVLQYRGLTFQGGGEKTLEEQVTIPNVLKKYNPNLFGYAVGTSSPNVWELARLNIAMPGGNVRDMPGQARQLVSLMQTHPESVDFENDWKLVNIFIGGNDVCGYCHHGGPSGEEFGNYLKQAIQILYDNIPRVIVSLLSMLHLEMIRTSDTGQYFCQALHVHECQCEGDLSFTNDQIAAVVVSYQQAAMALQTGGFFDGTRDDFTLVVQTAVNNSTEPPMKDGVPDQSFFSPDCFHFSQYGHAICGTWVWQNLMEPVGAKTVKANVSIPARPLACPDAACPFIRTTKNSANCAAYLTEPADS